MMGLYEVADNGMAHLLLSDTSTSMRDIDYRAAELSASVRVSLFYTYFRRVPLFPAP